jgi:integrase
MAKIRFYLTNKRAKVETKLYCFINYGLFVEENGKKKYLPLKYTTPFQVLPELWNAENNRAKESKKWADADKFEISQSAVEESARENRNKFNESLAVFELNATRIIFKLTVNNRSPRHDQVKTELDKIYYPDKFNANTNNINYQSFDLIQFIDHIVKTSADLKDTTKKSYNVVKRNIQDYQKKHKGKITPQNADIDFYNSFITFLTGKGLSKNTIGTRIKIIKTVLKYADEKNGVEVCQDYKLKSFAKPAEETESVYLTFDELNRIYNLTLPRSMDKVRDIFLIGCDTGLRFSDLSRLKKDNINSDNTISITTQKTVTKVVVPITPRVRNIFEKYDYKLPRVISNQKFNQYLKEIAKRAEIKEPVTITKTVKGMLVTRTVNKWELVTSHTARRSFATNAFLNDVPAIAIMKITGHKTESAFMKYIRMSPKDNAIKLQSHKFFTQMAVVK